MSEAITLIECAKKYLTEYLEGRMCHYEVTHPWRRDSKYIVLHSLRVHKMTQKIIASDLKHYSNEDRKMIELAAVLHDIGKVHQREKHGDRSAEIVEAWLETVPELKSEIPSIEQLLDMIRCHSEKGKMETDPLKAVLKDADSLDEVGILSIFMAANRLDHYSPWFFNQLKARLEDVEMPYCETLLKNLNTKGAKELLRKDMNFIKQFMEKLEQEIDGTQSLYQSTGPDLEPFDYQVLCHGMTK